MTALTDVVTEQVQIRRVREQGEVFTRQQRDESFSREVTTALRARRVWRGEHPVDLVVESPGQELLTVHGQVLIARAELERAEVRETLDGLGLQETETPEGPLGATVALLTGTGDLAEAVQRLRAAGVAVTLHHMVPAAGRPVVKPMGTGGPTTAAGLPPFAQYAAQA